MMQNELYCIVKRFKENDYCHGDANKENEYRRQPSKNDHNSLTQELQALKRKVRNLQATIEQMTTDGNKMHRFYEELICESTLQFQTFKEEYNGYRCSAAEERKEGENLVDFLSAKIEALNKELNSKEQMYRDLLEKYELLEQRANQVHLEGSEHVKNIEKQLAKQSMHHEEVKILTSKEIQQIRTQLNEAVEANEELLNQNHYLKSVNESLAHNIQYLKNRLYVENNLTGNQEQEENRLALIELERCDLESISRDQDRLTLEEIKMNDSRQMTYNGENGEKEVLNLSQHYSKFNGTQEFGSKEKSCYQFVMMESIERKSFAKRKELASQNKKVLVKIDSIESRSQENIKSRHITEIKQFKMQEAAPSQSVAVDPYRAFFVLMVQCQKMNSPYFERICHIDISYLYCDFVKNYVPYNLWQEAIRKELLCRLQKK